MLFDWAGERGRKIKGTVKMTSQYTPSLCYKAHWQNTRSQFYGLFCQRAFQPVPLLRTETKTIDLKYNSLQAETAKNGQTDHLTPGKTTPSRRTKLTTRRRSKLTTITTIIKKRIYEKQQGGYNI